MSLRFAWWVQYCFLWFFFYDRDYIRPIIRRRPRRWQLCVGAFSSSPTSTEWRRQQWTHARIVQWAGKPECDSSEKQTDRGEEKSVLVRDGKKVNTLSIRGFFTLRPLTASYPVHLSRTVSSSSELFHWWPIKYSVEAVIPAHTLSRPNRRTRFSVPSGAGPYDNMSKNHGGASLARIGMRARAHAWSYTSRGQGGGARLHVL